MPSGVEIMNISGEIQVKTGSMQPEEDSKLKIHEKIALSVGGISGTAHFQMLSMFLLFFYTDVMKISAAYVAGLFLLSQVLNVIVAPVFGIFVDKISTPWGKYKPYTIILGIPTALFGWLTFTDFHLSHHLELVYATFTYLIYSMLIAIAQAPGAALTPAMTKRLDERLSIGTFSYIFVLAGAMFVAIGVQPLYKTLGGGNEALGFTLLMAGFAVFCSAISIFQFINIKEKYVVKHNKDVMRPKLKEMIIAVFTNKAAIIVYVYVFASNLANAIRSAVMIHYFKYYFHNEALMVTVGAASLLPMIIGAILSPIITKRIGLKANVLTATIINVITMASIIAIPNSTSGVIILIVISIIGSLFTGFASPAQSAMMPAAMDYTEWKSGINVNAFMGSFLGLLQTSSTALAGAIAAGALVIVGYVPGVEQSNETIFGLKVLMGILPAVIISLTACVIWFDLTEEKQNQITKELAERRRTQ